MSIFAISLPIRTVTEANSREHFHKKHRRHQQQEIIVVKWCDQIRGRGKPSRVLFVRIGSRDLDWGDNLNMSFKHVRDSLARLCGFNDRERSIKWEYDQRRPAKGEALGMRLEIEWDDAAADVVKPKLPKPFVVEKDQGRLFT